MPEMLGIPFTIHTLAGDENEAYTHSQLFSRYETIENVGINLISRISKNKYNNNKLKVLKNTTNTNLLCSILSY